jgi:hypothetical protein
MRLEDSKGRQILEIQMKIANNGCENGFWRCVEGLGKPYFEEDFTYAYMIKLYTY